MYYMITSLCIFPYAKKLENFLITLKSFVNSTGRQMNSAVSSTLYGLDRVKKKKEVANKYNIPIENVIDLSGGDNLFIPPELIRKIIEKSVKKIDPRDSYPVNYSMFIEEISRFINVDANSIYLGFSHLSLIERALSITTTAKDKILLLRPDKSIYSKIANSHGLSIEQMDLDEYYKFDANNVADKVNDEQIKLILFSSPHFPTGNQFPENEVITLAKKIDIPIVIDESYVEFGKYSLINQVDYHSNFVVIRSFSKAWGLGAFSSAYLVGNPMLVNKLKTRHLIEEIPPINLLATLDIIQNPYRFVELIKNFVKERKRVYEHIHLIRGIKAFKSDSNFIFLQCENRDHIVDHLYSKGLIPQDFRLKNGSINDKSSLLITLGSREINDMIILSLVEALETML